MLTTGQTGSRQARLTSCAQTRGVNGALLSGSYLGPRDESHRHKPACRCAVCSLRVDIEESTACSGRDGSGSAREGAKSRHGLSVKCLARQAAWQRWRVCSRVKTKPFGRPTAGLDPPAHAQDAPRQYRRLTRGEVPVEVKEEGRAKPGPGDMNAAAHPTPSACHSASTREAQKHRPPNVRTGPRAAVGRSGR
jgi:hypothetical protein